MVEVFHLLSHHVATVARTVTSVATKSVGISTIGAACTILIGCVSPGSDGLQPFKSEGDAQSRAPQSVMMGAAGDHSARLVPDDAGVAIARDMAFSLSDLLQRTVRSMPRIALMAPARAFDLHLIDGLQRAGFEVFLDKGQTASSFLGYRFARLVAGGESAQAQVASYPLKEDRLAPVPGDARNFLDYRFTLLFDRWILSREYRVTADQVRPLAPVEVMAVEPAQPNQVASEWRHAGKASR